MSAKASMPLAPLPKPFPPPPPHLLTSAHKRVEAFSSLPEGVQQQQEQGQQQPIEEHEHEHEDEHEWEWEYEEEEHLVVMDVGPDAARLLKSAREVCLTGLETSTPLVRIGGTLFAGKWDELLGTELLFSVQKPPSGAKTRTVQPIDLSASSNLEAPLRCSSSSTSHISLSPVSELKSSREEKGEGQASPSLPPPRQQAASSGVAHFQKASSLAVGARARAAAGAGAGAAATIAPTKKQPGRPKFTDEERAQAGVLRALKKASGLPLGRGKIAAGSATAAAAAATAVRRTSEHVRSQGVRHEDESASQVDREQEQEQEQEQGQGQGQEQDDSMPVDDAIIGEVQQKAGRGAGQDDAANENEEDERMGT